MGITGTTGTVNPVREQKPRVIRQDIIDRIKASGRKQKVLTPMLIQRGFKNANESIVSSAINGHKDAPRYIKAICEILDEWESEIGIERHNEEPQK